MRSLVAKAVVCLVLLLVVMARASAQESAPAPGPAASDLIRVFLDCQRCDSEHLRQNVGFVDYVLDRAVADVHVLVTTQNTGGGGLSWAVRFMGVGRYAGQEQTLQFDTSSTATEDERRTAFARIFRLGLASRAAGTRAAPQIDVTWTKPADSAGTVTRDPWDYWVFNMRVSGNANGQRSSSSTYHNLFVSANRTTDTLKLAFSASGNSEKNKFEIEDAPTIVSRRNSHGLSAAAIRSLTARWSAGVTASLSHSSFSNLDRAVAAAPALEFNVFPYSESSRRSLTLQYAVGATVYRYAELTIYDRIAETIPRHAMGATLGLRQPWGSLSVSSRFSQHLSNPGRYNGSVWSSADVRLFKGFSFNVYAEYERIKDQISLRKSSASEQEVLLRLQQLATGYGYYLNLGINYRFGSIFNNTVNTRFDSRVF